MSADMAADPWVRVTPTRRRQAPRPSGPAPARSAEILPPTPVTPRAGDPVPMQHYVDELERRLVRAAERQAAGGWGRRAWRAVRRGQH